MLEAWRRHPSSAAVDAQLAAARARLNAAGQPLYNPELTFDAEDGGPDRTVTGGVSLTIDVRNKRGARRDAAAARLTVAEARAHLIRQQFARQWLQSWADLHSARERVAIGNRRLVAVQRFRDVARKQFTAQDISGLERDLAQLALDEAQAEQATLLAELSDAEARLRTVGGAPEAFVTEGLPTQQLPLRLPPVQGELSALPELQVATAEALATEREVAVATGNRRADPTIGVRAGRIDLEDGRSDNVAGVSVSVPLFVRNSYRAEVTAAQADASAAGAEATRVRLQLDAERQRAIASYTAARAAWGRWESSRGTDVDRRTALLERLLREGEISPSDYLQQLKQTLDTQLAGAELEARVWRSWADYLAATGQLDRWARLDGTP
jgi:cobalt-zinc-cadmium efflux system outer membrane protein